MKPEGSRRKGVSFELKVAKALAGCLGVDQRQYIQRSPDSGARDASEWKGDIVALPPLDAQWPWFIECKKVEGWSLDQLFSGSQSTMIHKWCEKAVSQAKLSGKDPLVVFSKNRSPVLVAGPVDSVGWVGCRKGTTSVLTFDLDARGLKVFRIVEFQWFLDNVLRPSMELVVRDLNLMGKRGS